MTPFIGNIEHDDDAPVRRALSRREVLALLMALVSLVSLVSLVVRLHPTRHPLRPLD